MILSCVAGTRPNFVKAAALYHAFKSLPGIDFQLIHTGQHYDTALDALLFEQLELPAPLHRLPTPTGNATAQIAQMMLGLNTIFTDEKPDVVLVPGDTNSTLAGALAAHKCGIPVAHVEAGLRSGDRSMPEEINRILVDHLSDWLFVTEPAGLDNLRKEGIPEHKIYHVGNVVIDTLLRTKSRLTEVPLPVPGLQPGGFYLLTLHRPANVDIRAALELVLEWVAQLATLQPVVFPVHPRTRKNLMTFNLFHRLEGLAGVHLVAPLGYFEFIGLLSNAAAVITDSGGVQEESTFLGVPCFTLRTSTERPITVEMGTNTLVPSLDFEKMAAKLKQACPAVPPPAIPFWDGQAAQRIAAVLTKG